MIPITLHFDGDIPSAGLDADEVAAVADGMAKAVQFLAGRAANSQRDYTLHLREVKPGSATFASCLKALLSGSEPDSELMRNVRGGVVAA